jgi:hypothetical protein
VSGMASCILLSGDYTLLKLFKEVSELTSEIDETRKMAIAV